MTNERCCKIVRALPQFVEGKSFVGIVMNYDDWSIYVPKEDWRLTIYRPHGKLDAAYSGRGETLHSALDHLCRLLGEPVPNIDDQSDPCDSGHDSADASDKFLATPRGDEEARELEQDRTPERWDGQS